MTRLDRRSLMQWGLAGVAGLVGGCTTGAAVRPPELMLPGGISPVLDGPAPQDGDAWWQSLGDPEITALVERALARGPDVLQALAQVEAARAQRAQSLAAFGLTGGLDANAQARRTEIVNGDAAGAGGAAPAPGSPPATGAPGSGTSAGTGLIEGTERSATVTAGFGWEIDLFQRLPAVRAAGNAELAAALANSSAARLAVAAAVADAVYELRSLNARLADAQQFERLQAELLRYLRAREAVGVGARADAERAAVATAQLHADVLRLRAEEQAAVRRLLTLTRSNAEPPAVGLSALPANLPEPPAQLPSDLLLRRPDVQVAYQRYLAQTARLRSADQALLPRLMLEPGVSFLASRTPVRADAVTTFVGLRVTAPLFDRQRLLAAVREQGANAEMAVIDLERTVDRAFSEADQALTLYLADVQRLPALDEAQQRAEQLRASATKLLQASLVDARTALEAEREWRQARSAWLDAHFLAARRRVDTFRAVGGGWAGFGR